MPHELGFHTDHGGVPDARGEGTGFTYVDPPRTGTGYEPSRLSSGDGVLRITTGPGIAYLRENSLENRLAVGIQGAARVFSVQTTINRPPRGTGRYEQGGLWVGTDQDNYVKLVTISYRARTGVQLLGEAGSPGARFARRFVSVPNLEEHRVRLVLRGNAEAGTVAGFYSIDGGELIHVATFTPPPHLLTGGSAVNTLLNGGRLAGIFASHRLGAGPLDYHFDSFEVDCHNDGCRGAMPGSGPGGAHKTPAPGGHVGLGKGVRATGVAGSLRATLWHQRSIRVSRLVSRGIPVLLRCSEPCWMRARARASRSWAQAVGFADRRSGITVGSGNATRRRAGKVRTRLTVLAHMRPRLRRVLPPRVAIEATVRASDGRRVRLRSFVRARR
jgi:hypothetical protein